MGLTTSRFRYQNLKDNVNITEVVEKITGKPIPQDGMICCPIHQERTPSMKINPMWNGAKCFGACNKWFDPISLWASMNNLRSIDALKDLEKLFEVKWSGARDDEEDEDDSIFEYGFGHKLFLKFDLFAEEYCKWVNGAKLSVTDRIEYRRVFWEATHTKNTKALYDQLGHAVAKRIVNKWMKRCESDSE